MIIPLILLSFLSILSGFLFSDIMIGSGSIFWKNSINLNFFYYEKYLFLKNINFFFLLPYEFTIFIYYYVFFNSIYLIIFSFFIFKFYLFFIYLYSFGISKYYFYLTLNVNKKMLFFNRLWINNFLGFFFYESYKHTYKLVDKNIFEIIGPFGIIYNIRCILNKLIFFQSGLIYHYLGIILLFILYSIYFLIINYY